MRYRLRTLLILLAVGPPMLAGALVASVAIHRHFSAVDQGYNFARPPTVSEQAELDKLIDLIEEAEKNRKSGNEWPSTLEIVTE